MGGAVGKGAAVAVEKREVGGGVEGDAIREGDGEGAEEGVGEDGVIVWKGEEPPCAVNIGERGGEDADLVEGDGGG